MHKLKPNDTKWCVFNILISNLVFVFPSYAATGPNRQVGRPRQGRGAPRRDPPMAGTWAPIERGVTATSSKCPVFKGTEGELSPSPDVSAPLCQPVIIPATSLPPHCLHLCIRNTDSLLLLPLLVLLRTLSPCLLSLCLTLSHAHNAPRAVSQIADERACCEERVPPMKTCTCAGCCRLFSMRERERERGCSLPPRTLGR